MIRHISQFYQPLISVMIAEISFQANAYRNLAKIMSKYLQKNMTDKTADFIIQNFFIFLYKTI